MRKNVVVVIAVAIIFLLGSLFLKEKSPITTLVCKNTASSDCDFDDCGFCKNYGEAGVKASEIFDYDCSVHLGSWKKTSGGHICKKANSQCRLQKTRRTTVCEILLGTYLENKRAEESARQKSIYVDIFGK